MNVQKRQFCVHPTEHIPSAAGGTPLMHRIPKVRRGEQWGRRIWALNTCFGYNWGKGQTFVSVDLFSRVPHGHCGLKRVEELLWFLLLHPQKTERDAPQRMVRDADTSRMVPGSSRSSSPVRAGFPGAQKEQVPVQRRWQRGKGAGSDRKPRLQLVTESSVWKAFWRHWASQNLQRHGVSTQR